MSLEKLQQTVNHIEEVILSLLLITLVALSCIQIGLRLFFDSGFSWADPLLRYLVVWSGLLGALLAVSQKKHISIDISDFAFTGKAKDFLAIITQLFSSAVCMILSYASWLFLQSEMEFESESFLAIPSWAWNGIFFLAFALMSLRYLLGGAISFSRLTSARKAEEGHGGK